MKTVNVNGKDFVVVKSKVMQKDEDTIQTSERYEVYLDLDLAEDPQGNIYHVVSIFDEHDDGTQILVYDMSQTDALMLGAILDRSKVTFC